MSLENVGVAGVPSLCREMTVFGKGLHELSGVSRKFLLKSQLQLLPSLFFSLNGAKNWFGCSPPPAASGPARLRQEQIFKIKSASIKHRGVVTPAGSKPSLPSGPPGLTVEGEGCPSND